MSATILKRMLELGAKVWLKIRQMQVGGAKHDYVIVKYEFAIESDHRNSWFSKLKNCNCLSLWLPEGKRLSCLLQTLFEHHKKG